MVQEISEIWPQWEQSPGPEMFLTPRGVLETRRPRRSVTTAFMGKGSPDRQLKGNPKAMVIQDGGNLVGGTYGTLV